MIGGSSGSTTNYRLYRKKTGELILQRLYEVWENGVYVGEVWKDIDMIFNDIEEKVTGADR